MRIVDVVNTLLSQWSIPQARELLQYLDEKDRVICEIKCCYMTLDIPKAYSLVKNHETELKPYHEKLYSLIVSIYRYRYKNKFQASKKTLPSHQIIAYLFPPLVCKNEDEVNTMLEKYQVGLRWLLHQPPGTLPIDIQLLVPASYHLSYLGRDITQIFKLRHDAFKCYFNIPNFQNIYSLFDFKYDMITNIGFISSNFIPNHSVMRDRLGLIQHLDRTKYNVYILELIPTENIDFGIVTKIPLYVHGVKVIDIANDILNLNLDILFYCDIGMDGLTYQLACSRLATKQITTWGHSDTTGCREIDIYVTSKYFLSQSTNHTFTEKLVLFNSLSTFYTPLPHLTHPDGLFGGVDPQQRRYRARNILKSLGLCFNNSDVLLLIGSTAQKITYKYLDIIDELSDWIPPTGKLLLPCGTCKHEPQVIKEMYEHKRSKGKSKLLLIPPLDPVTFSLLIGACDIFLDTYPFGCCNSILECFAMGVPFVTYPSKFQYGNFVKGFIDYTESKLLTQLIVDSPESYIEKVDDILYDQSLQNKISKELITVYPKLLNDQATIDEYDKLFKEILY